MADTTGTDWAQIKSANRHGTGAKGQASDGTGTNTHIAVFDATGTLTDGGVPISGAGGSWFAEVPTGALNGTNKIFTVTYTPISGSLTLFLNIDQREGTDFTISTNTITFAVAPKARDTGWFYARYQH